VHPRAGVDAGDRDPAASAPSRQCSARSYAELAAGRALVLDVARAFDAGDIPRHRIAAAKLFCTEMASRIADRCVQILGGEGIVGDHPIPRMWRDVRALRIYEGTSQIHQRNLARHLEGLAEEAPGALVRGY
jgi:acyl-CoA dehydrogenase